jgi:hypothetical protein
MSRCPVKAYFAIETADSSNLDIASFALFL